MENKKYPEVRFKGFSGEWGEVYLGSVVDIIGGGTPNTNIPEFWNGNIDWYSPKEIGNDIFVSGSQKKITELGLKSSSAKVLPAKKTVLFSSRAGIGDMAILNKPAATNQGFQSFIVKKIDVYFLYSIGFKIKNFALDKASGSTFLEISGNQLARCNLFVPLRMEQTQIGNFFQNLDQAITLQQTKLEKTQNLKEAMLEEMFPKEGSKQPEIRLKGFSGDWIKYELLDIVKPISSYSLSREVETVNITGYRYIHYGDIHRGRVGIVHSEFDLPNIKPGKFEVLKRGDLVVADASEDYKGIAMPCVIDCEINDMVVAGLHTIAVRPIKANSIFLYYLIHTNLFKNYARLVGTGTKVFGITSKNFLNFSCYYPCIEEQTAIGNFFKTLDETLVLQQQQLNTLKNLKHAFLDKMFV